MRVERREVPARAGRDPAPEGGELEGLREVTERQPVRAELPFEIGAERAGLDTRGARDRVDLQHARESAEVEGACRAPPSASLDSADHAGAAAVGRDRDARLRAGFQRAGDVLLRSRQADEVRRGGEVAGEAADEIAVGTAVGVAQPGLGRRVADVGDGGRRGDRRWWDSGDGLLQRRQRPRVGRWAAQHGRDLDAERQARRLVGQPLLPSPPPEAAPHRPRLAGLDAPAPPWYPAPLGKVPIV